MDRFPVSTNCIKKFNSISSGKSFILKLHQLWFVLAGEKPCLWWWWRWQQSVIAGQTGVPAQMRRGIENVINDLSHLLWSAPATAFIQQWQCSDSTPPGGPENGHSRSFLDATASLVSTFLVNFSQSWKTHLAQIVEKYFTYLFTRMFLYSKIFFFRFYPPL